MAQYDAGAIVARFVEGIAADIDFRITVLYGAQALGHVAFAERADERLRADRLTALEVRRQPVDHCVRHLRDSGHHIDVLDLKSGRHGNAVLDERGAFRRIRHPQPRLVYLHAALLEAFDQAPIGFGMAHQLAAERLGDRFRRDVVMGRADPAGGEDIVVLRPHGVDGIDDLVLNVGHHARFGEADAGLVVQLGGDIGEVGVLNATGQDFVADDDQCRRNNLLFAHDVPISCAAVNATG